MSALAALFFVSTPTTAQAAPAWVSHLASQPALSGVSPSERQEVTCIALAIYFEARGESTRGQQAVGNVVMNRVRSGRYPKTACGVLFQRGQFSFIRAGSPSIPRTPALWDRAIRMAQTVLGERAHDASGGALSFRQRHLRRGGTVIGGHTFF